MKKVVIATSNQGKLKEYREMLSPLAFDCLSLDDINYKEDIVETGKNFLENSKIKAEKVYNFCHLPVIGDDSGLMVKALLGNPGIYSRRYAGENATDQENTDKLLKELKKTGNSSDFDACFICFITYIDSAGEISVFGELRGKIILEKRGKNGFGYDPVFYLDEYKKTVAELDEGVKNLISHRSKALNNLVLELKRRKDI